MPGVPQSTEQQLGSAAKDGAKILKAAYRGRGSVIGPGEVIKSSCMQGLLSKPRPEKKPLSIRVENVRAPAV